MARTCSKSGGAFALSFKGLPEASLQAGSAFLRGLLERHFQRWPFSVVSDAQSRPLFRVEEKGRGFRLCSSEGREHFDTAAEMLCDLGIGLAEAFVARTPGLQCLHCSAVSFPAGGEEKLVVFPNVNRAGKSLLAACLMLEGARLFADDLLGVTQEGEGVSFGLPPRLRLPLPASASRLAGTLGELPGLGDGRYHFLYAWDSIAPFSQKLPIGAVVLPCRRAEGEGVRLRRLSVSGALQCMAYQFQMREGQAGAVFELARSLCESLPLWELEYGSPEEASALLMQEAGRLFTAAEEGEDAVQDVGFLTEEDRLSSSMHGRRRRPFPSDRNLHWLRAPGMHIHEAGSFAYLIPKEQDSVFGVDGIGLAVVALLSGPLSVSEAARLLAEAYPQTGLARLESDMTLFFRSLYERGLIVPVPR